MSPSSEYLAILRCQTWNVWPEKFDAEYQPFSIDYGALVPIPARFILFSYDQRTSAERYVNEETKLGPLVWNGEVYGLYKILNSVLKAPEDSIEVKFQQRHIQRGEIDIFINFKFTGELPLSLVEALRATANSILSLINLKFNDYLVPTAPFQIRKVLPDGMFQLETGFSIGIFNRETLSPEVLKPILANIADVLVKSVYGVKLRTALELYAAHFTEQQVRVRFLLLVVALESLAKPTKKHHVTLDLLSRWQQEIKSEMVSYEKNSEEFMSLESLQRELRFRSEDSLRCQIRKLFMNLPDLTDEEIKEIQRRALRVYDKRSTLVHEGELPDKELAILEVETREILIKLFLADIDQQKD